MLFSDCCSCQLVMESIGWFRTCLLAHDQGPDYAELTGATVTTKSMRHTSPAIVPYIAPLPHRSVNDTIDSATMQYSNQKSIAAAIASHDAET